MEPASQGAASGVAGRIAPQPTTLAPAVDSWTDWLRSRRRKPASIAGFRELVERAARECGWVTTADLTLDAVTRWLASHEDWKASTYNRNLSAFRSLTRYLAASDRITKDPLVLASRIDGDAEEGARPLTLAEARAIVAQAWYRQQADRRTKGDRALYWTTLFLAGCRVGEPAQWTWANLALDEPIPFIQWLPSFNKNRRKQETALAPELVTLLREHRETVPHGPKDKVFPIVPPRTTFRQDRDRAMVPAMDARGRGCSPHSTRKTFAQWLKDAGVSDSTRNDLMRHTLTIDSRYAATNLADQLAALRGLAPLHPRFWSENLEKGVDTGAETVDDGPVTAVEPMTTTRNNSIPNPSSASGHGSAVTSKPGKGSESSRFDRMPPARGSKFNPAIRSGNADVRLQRADEIADLILDAVARRLPKGASDDDRNQSA